MDYEKLIIDTLENKHLSAIEEYDVLHSLIINTSKDVFEFSAEQLLKYCKENQIKLENNRVYFYKYIYENCSSQEIKKDAVEYAIYNIIKQKNEKKDEKDDNFYVGKAKNICELLKDLNKDVVNEILENYIDDVCSIIIKDKERVTRNRNYQKRFFSKLSPELLKEAIQYISENSNQIVKTTNYSTMNDSEVMVEMFLDIASDDIIVQKSNELRKIINDNRNFFDDLMDKLRDSEGFNKSNTRRLFDRIDFLCDKESNYKEMSKIPIRELVNRMG